MRPLPRLLAITDDAICADQDFPIHAAAVLSAGSGVAIVVRALATSPDQRRQYLERVLALARPTEASLIAFQTVARVTPNPVAIFSPEWNSPSPRQRSVASVSGFMVRLSHRHHDSRTMSGAG